MMNKLFQLILLGLYASSLSRASAEPIPEYEMKSTYLYYFAVYADWDESIRPNLNICIIGKDLFGTTINSLENKEINGRRVTIKHLTNLENVSTCQILYFSESDLYSPKHILSAVADLPILTITDNALANDFMINLKVDKNRLMFDINYEAMKKNRLTMSSKVLNLAHRVY